MLLVANIGQTAFAVEATRILIVVGPTNHPPGTHEVAAGGRLMKHCLENMANVTPLATSMLPPEMPKPETVSWCIERPDSGRGFAVVMPHFYRNWSNAALAKFLKSTAFGIS